MLEEDVVDVILETDISVSSSEVELVEEEEEELALGEGASERKQRREVRARSASADPLPPLPLPAMTPPPAGMKGPEGSPKIEFPPPAQMNRSVLCNSCGGRFEVSSGLKMTKCPVCDERIDLW